MQENQEKTDPSSGSTGMRVAVAVVLRPHGIRGEVKVKSLSDLDDRLASIDEVVLEFEDGRTEARIVEGVRGAGGTTIVRFEGISDRDEAVRLRGAYMTVPRSSAPELDRDTYYASDLIGLRVVDEEGAEVGTVRDIETYPANDVIIVRTATGDVLVAAVRDYVLGIDTDSGTVTIRVPRTADNGAPRYD